MWALYIFIGILIGVAATVWMLRRHTVGTIQIDTSDPEGPPLMFARLSKNVSDVMHKKYVVMRIKVEDIISQK